VANFSERLGVVAKAPWYFWCQTCPAFVWSLICLGLCFGCRLPCVPVADWLLCSVLFTAAHVSQVLRLRMFLALHHYVGHCYNATGHTRATGTALLGQRPRNRATSTGHDSVMPLSWPQSQGHGPPTGHGPEATKGNDHGAGPSPRAADPGQRPWASNGHSMPLRTMGHGHGPPTTGHTSRVAGPSHGHGPRATGRGHWSPTGMTYRHAPTV